MKILELKNFLQRKYESVKVQKIFYKNYSFMTPPIQKPPLILRIETPPTKKEKGNSQPAKLITMKSIVLLAITMLLFASSLLQSVMISSDVNMVDYIQSTDWSDSRHQYYVLLLIVLSISALALVVFRFYIIMKLDKLED